MSFSTKKLLFGALAVIALIGLPAAIFISQKQAEIRSKALTSTPMTPTVCGNSPIDLMLIIDTSDSMNDKFGSTGTKMSNAITAAENFANIIGADTRNKLGLVSFSKAATLNSPLTSNISSVKSQISSLSTSGGTCIQCAIDKANKEIGTNGRTGIKKVAVLLTDGRANWMEGTTGYVSTAAAELAALNTTKAGYASNQTAIYTIGLGNNVNGDFLQEIATLTGATYNFSPTTDQLDNIYSQISQIIAKGSISGFVFNDANGNKVYDPTETKLSGWTLKLLPQGSTTAQTVISDTKGNFTFTNLCDGMYALTEVKKTGWVQTLPSSTNGYSSTITNGNAIINQNFGDMVAPTPTFTPVPSLTPTPTPRPSLTPTPVLKPDLIVTGMQVTYDGSSGSYICSTGIGLRVTIKNQGTGAVTGSFVVKANNTLATVSGGLAAGASTSIWIKDYVTGTNTAIVDANNQINESDETNNQLTQQLPVPTQPLECVPTNTPTPTHIPTPTTTPAPFSTVLNLTVFFHGIGNSGDNANPTGTSLSNKTPLHPTQLTAVTIFDANNRAVATLSGNVVYNTTNGNYSGSFNAGSTLSTGNYNIKVRNDRHLDRLIPGIQLLTAGTSNNLRSIDVVAGDINNDNKLDILDYNILLGCYSDFLPAASCTQTQNLQSDINDDGLVNQFDYNLFLRELSVQNGD